MKPYSRAERVSGHIQRILAEILHHKVKDPRLAKVTITGVKTSRDLKVARVYFVTAGGRQDTEQVVAGFKSALGYVKRTLAPQLGLRYMPELKFFYDASLEYGANIDQLLQSLHTDNGSDHSAIEE